MPAKTQNEIVKERLGERAEMEKEFLTPPGFKELHQKPKEDQATVIINLLKSRPRIRELRWVVGKGIEITWEKIQDHPY